MSGSDPVETSASERPQPPLGGTPRRSPPGAWWLALLAVAVVEVAGHLVIRARVPAEADWVAAAARVRAEEGPTDLIEVAPAWASPILRAHLGDRISLAGAGPSDRAPWERLWVLSIRGAEPRPAPKVAPELDELFGRVRVRRYLLGPSPVLYDFVERVPEAEVVMVRNGEDVPCRWQPRGTPRGGGLGAGPMTPGARHQCDLQRPWLWVGATVTEDLALQPRRCVWQHPAGMEPIRATFRNVPLGDRLILYGGIYYEHERMREHGQVYVTVRVNDVDVGRMIHEDGDGWMRMEVDPRQAISSAGDDARGDVTIDVMAPAPHLRTFCWSATTRAGEPGRDAP